MGDRYPIRTKRIENKDVRTFDEEGFEVSSVMEADESHAYFQWFDDDPTISDYKSYAEIFEYALGSEYSRKLFQPKFGSAYALKPVDFKACEERRLCHYSTRTEDGSTAPIPYRVNVLFERWYCASTFAKLIIETYETYRDRQTPQEHISCLELQTRHLKEQLPQKPLKEFTEDEIQTQILFDEKIGELEWFKRVGEAKGFAVTKGRNYAARACAYQLNHLTFCQFGDATPTRQAKGGKNSGRGLPSLTAKIINLLFDLSGKDRLRAKDVSQIYERGAPKLSSAHSVRMRASRP